MHENHIHQLFSSITMLNRTENKKHARKSQQETLRSKTHKEYLPKTVSSGNHDNSFQIFTPLKDKSRVTKVISNQYCESAFRQCVYRLPQVTLIIEMQWKIGNN